MFGEVLRQVLAQECRALAGAGQLLVGQRMAVQLHDLHDCHPILRRDGVHRLSHGDAVLLRAVVLHHVGRDQALIGALAQDRRERIFCAATIALVEPAVRLLQMGRGYGVVTTAASDAANRAGCR
ncbi:hypothetical protein D3C81_1357650 [compost metagenome]